MTNSDEAIREFAEKYKNGGYRIVNDYAGNKTMQHYDNKDELIFDLTALISEHYYPKEFVGWTIIEAISANKDGTFALCIDNGLKAQWFNYTLDELFNYWKENER